MTGHKYDGQKHGGQTYDSSSSLEYMVYRNQESFEHGPGRLFTDIKSIVVLLASRSRENVVCGCGCGCVFFFLISQERAAVNRK